MKKKMFSFGINMKNMIPKKHSWSLYNANVAVDRNYNPNV